MNMKGRAGRIYHKERVESGEEQKGAWSVFQKGRREDGVHLFVFLPSLWKQRLDGVLGEETVTRKNGFISCWKKKNLHKAA